MKTEGENGCEARNTDFGSGTAVDCSRRKLGRCSASYSSGEESTLACPLELSSTEQAGNVLG